MRIAAAICWYDEPLEHLQRVVAAVAPIADVIVAYDGPWRGFPKERRWKSQVDDMRSIFDVAGITAYALSSNVRWKSQAAKRTELYRTAAELADWVLVVDADEDLLIDDVSGLRQQIARITREKAADAIKVRVATPGPDRKAGGKDTATAPHGVRWQPRLLRADMSLTVGPHSHRTIVTDSAVIQMESDEDRALHVSRRAARIATIHGVSIVNRTHSRSAARIAAKQAYGKARAERGID